MTLDARLLQLLNEADSKTTKKYYNPKTGNKVGYVRALQLGLVKDEPRARTSKEKDTGTQTKSKATPKEKKKEPSKQKHWWSDFTKYRLSGYPVNINEKDVKVDLSGDINSHWVMSWKSPKTGKTVFAYTQTFLQKNADIKWKRVQKIKTEDVEGIKSMSSEIIDNKKSDDKLKQAAAVIGIIAHTGLRVGSVKGYEYSGNRGISTLSPDNVTVKGDTVYLNFIGKSYQENTSQFTDPILATYLEKLVQTRKGQEFLFNVPKSYIDQVYDNHMEMKDFKIKDLRTYVATETARKILLEDKTPPPPLPEKPSEVKKVVKEKLKSVFEKVSQILNNTPAMARSSYVHPKIITSWLKQIGVEPQEHGFAESEQSYKKWKNKISEVGLSLETESIGEEDAFDECDQYPLPNWWDNDNIELIPVNGLSEIEENTKNTKEYFSIMLYHYGATKLASQIKDDVKKLGGDITTDDNFGDYRQLIIEVTLEDMKKLKAKWNLKQESDVYDYSLSKR